MKQYIYVIHVPKPTAAVWPPRNGTGTSLHGLGPSGLPAVISCWTGVEEEMLTESGAGLRSGTRSTPQRRSHG